MKSKLVTPIVIAAGDSAPWLDRETAFYVVSRDGPFLCRNHEFFQSCAPVDQWPGELAPCQPFFKPRFPDIPRKLLEWTVGFFTEIAELHGSEAGLFLAYDRDRGQVRLVVPHQEATVMKGWYGSVFPVGLHYEVPVNLAPELVIFGDVHSHVDAAAYASGTDIHDEVHRPGLHIVIGRIFQEQPEWHLDAVVDGVRFPVPAQGLIDGYQTRRRDFPKQWLQRVNVIEKSYWRQWYPEESEGQWEDDTNGGSSLQ